MFMCAGEWVTLGLNIPLLFYHLWRYTSQPTSSILSQGFLVVSVVRTLSLVRFFHRPADGSEVMYDPVSVMNADILNYCQKESWCKLGFYLLSFFYYLYRWGPINKAISHQSSRFIGECWSVWMGASPSCCTITAVSCYCLLLLGNVTFLLTLVSSCSLFCLSLCPWQYGLCLGEFLNTE